MLKSLHLIVSVTEPFARLPQQVTVHVVSVLYYPSNSHLRGHFVLHKTYLTTVVPFKCHCTLILLLFTFTLLSQIWLIHFQNVPSQPATTLKGHLCDTFIYETGTTTAACITSIVYLYFVVYFTGISNLILLLHRI